MVKESYGDSLEKKVDYLILVISGSEDMGIPGLVNDVKYIKNKMEKYDEEINMLKIKDFDNRLNKVEKFKEASWKIYGAIISITSLLTLIITRLLKWHN